MSEASLANGWTVVRLGDTGRWFSGGTPSRANATFWTGVIPWVSPKDMKVFHLKDSIEHISPTGAAFGSCLVEPNAVLFVIRGMILAHTFPVGIATRRVAFNQDMKAIVCTDDTDPLFLGYWLLANQQRILSLASESTHGTKRFDLADLTSLEVERPKLSEQRKIARILTTLDNLIEKTESLIAKYQAVNQGMMHDLFTRGVDAHGKLRPRQSEAPELYKQSDLGWIPIQWNVRPLGEIADVSGGVTLGRKLCGTDVVELPYLRVANVQDGYLDLGEMKSVSVLKSEVERFRLQPGDVLMTEGGDFDKLGRGTVWRGEIGLCLHQNHVFRVRPSRESILPEFLACVTASTIGKQYFLISSKQTTNLASINSTQIKQLPVPLPSLEEQTRFIDASTALDQCIDNEQFAVAKTRCLKFGLMQDLLTGKVRVNVDSEGVSAHA